MRMGRPRRRMGFRCARRLVPLPCGSGAGRLRHRIRDPNGFSRRPDDSFVVAGLNDGHKYQIATDGRARTPLESIDGVPLGSVNYACAAGPGRICSSVMTRHLPWVAALRSSTPDDYVVHLDTVEARAQIAADRLDFTNEIKVSPEDRYRHAAETLDCRIVGFPVRPEGPLGANDCADPRSLGWGSLPDGIIFDAVGNVWVAITRQNPLSSSGWG